MIFVTVGTQFSFDRLIKGVDSWFEDTNQSVEVVAQICQSAYLPKRFVFQDFLAANEFDEKFKEAEFIVSHAGMGNIIKAIDYRKRIIIMPRRSELGEHRNDHQIDTSKYFESIDGIEVVNTDKELRDALSRLTSKQQIGVPERNDSCELEKLFEHIRSFLREG
jgi:UDP-N-acetylglucosamine transferase subunit ALG13